MENHQKKSFDKIAKILVLLGKDIASDILKNFSREEVLMIARTMQNIKRIPEHEVDQLLFEFLKVVETKSTSTSGGLEATQKILKYAFKGEQGELLSKEIGSLTPKIDAVEQVDSKLLASLISEEHPQTIAVIIAFCPAKKAGDTLKQLSSELRTEVLFKLVNLGNISTELIEDVNLLLKEKIHKMNAHSGNKIGGIDSILKMLATLPPKQAQEFIDHLAHRDPELADQINQKMFTFKHLIKVSDSDIKTILSNIKLEQLKDALVGEEDIIVEKFTHNMSERAKELFLDDLKILKRKQAEVFQAQQSILKKIKELEQEGKLTLFEKVV